MYSGTTLTKFSGRILGAHQRIDRVARNHLARIADTQNFPKIRRILYFEGVNGPDAIKRKSPAQDEPWHYIDPTHAADRELIDHIQDHYDRLVRALKRRDENRAAFEAAWLAHAIVDGLTPAHHYPYAQKLTELRGGLGLETRTTIKHKLVMPGATTTKKLANNWKMWGPGGLITSHGMFEIGIATLITPLRFGEAVPSRTDIKRASKIGAVEWFIRTAKTIAKLNLYDDFQRKGWTPKMAWQIRHRLGPKIVKTVTLAWYCALHDAGLTDGKK